MHCVLAVTYLLLSVLVAVFTAVLSGKTLVACCFFLPWKTTCWLLQELRNRTVQAFSCRLQWWISTLPQLLVLFLKILNEELLVRKCEWLTESTVDSKISKLADTCYHVSS